MVRERDRRVMQEEATEGAERQENKPLDSEMIEQIHYVQEHQSHVCLCNTDL